jgi:hypothetical protein
VKPVDQLAVALLAYTAAGHGMEIAPHWQEGWPLGLFFAVVTAVLAGQGLSLARRPSATTYATVVPTTVVLIVLYFLVREITVPFMDHRDPYLWSELVLKAAEGVLVVVAAGRLRRRPPVAPGVRPGEPRVSGDDADLDTKIGGDLADEPGGVIQEQSRVEDVEDLRVRMADALASGRTERGQCPGELARPRLVQTLQEAPVTAQGQRNIVSSGSPGGQRHVGAAGEHRVRFGGRVELLGEGVGQVAGGYPAQDLAVSVGEARVPGSPAPLFEELLVDAHETVLPVLRGT